MLPSCGRRMLDPPIKFGTEFGFPLCGLPEVGGIRPIQTKVGGSGGPVYIGKIIQLRSTDRDQKFYWRSTSNCSNNDDEYHRGLSTSTTDS
jgi:hypothetical protein